MVQRRLVTGTASLAACMVLTACGSIKSRIYDTDNVTSGERQVKCLKGIPETIDVPTHVVIRIQETKYYRGPTSTTKCNAVAALMPKKADEGETAEMLSAPDAEDPAPDPEQARLLKDLEDAKKQLEEAQKQLKVLQDRISNQSAKLMWPETAGKLNKDILELQDKVKDLDKQLKAIVPAAPAVTGYSIVPLRATRAMDYDFITRKELFTVDFKRPVSGVGDTKLTYGPLSGGQFFSSVGQTTQDTTITDIGGLVLAAAKANVQLKAIAKESTDAVKTAQCERENKGLVGITSTVAIEYFDIHQPNLEGRIQEFLERHINLCSPTCNAVGPSCPESAIQSAKAGAKPQPNPTAKVIAKPVPTTAVKLPAVAPTAVPVRPTFPLTPVTASVLAMPLLPVPTAPRD